MKWFVDFTTTSRRERGSMPRLVKSSRPSACVRLVISTASTPPTRTAAQSPSGTRVGPKPCQQSRASPTTSKGIDRQAGGRRRLAAEAQRECRAQPGVEAQADGDRIPDRAERGLFDPALDQ